MAQRVQSNPLDDPLDRVLAEIAIRVQLPPSKHQLACDRYKSVAAYADREGSPLRGLIARFYPQGSMSIGATISARGRTEEYDIDVVAELLFRRGADPAAVLNILFEAIRGEPGSRYYKMVKRRTRCVTVYYEDGMHLDITPVILRNDRQDRTSDLFHDDPDEPSEPAETLLMNAWGFSQFYKAATADTTSFASAYAKDTRVRDVHAEAETEEVDPQDDPAQKSSDVVALQLIKRMRNTQYASRTARMPPSVLLSKYNADAASPMESLSQAVLHHATYMRRQLALADAKSILIHEENPTCREDCFTDRWPLNRFEQRLFIGDLDNLISTLKRLMRDDVSIKDMLDCLSEIFGEAPTRAAVRATQDHIGAATRAASTGHRVGGGLVLAACATARPARASTNMGGVLPRR